LYLFLTSSVGRVAVQRHDPAALPM